MRNSYLILDEYMRFLDNSGTAVKNAEIIYTQARGSNPVSSTVYKIPDGFTVETKKIQN